MKITNIAYQNINKSRTAPSRVTAPSFQGNYDASFLYKKSLSLHLGNIAKTNPNNVEKYFANLGIPATFREGSQYSRQYVAYCCYHTAEVFKQLGFSLPTKIDMTNLNKLSPELNTAIGICNYHPITPTVGQPKSFPIRSVIFNTFEDKNQVQIGGSIMPVGWENMPSIIEDRHKKGFFSANHFMQSFIHEFAHSLHFDKLFTKFGCQVPGTKYTYNPDVAKLFQKINLPINKQFVKPITNNISGYGATQLPETFAEAFTKDVVKNMDVFTLRLTQNPFPSKKSDDIVTQILNETWEGLVGDGKGLV